MRTQVEVKAVGSLSVETAEERKVREAEERYNARLWVRFRNWINSLDRALWRRIK